MLGRLIDARLLTVEGAGRDESTVELVHESLIETWPALARWLEEEQENAQFRARLRGAAKEWEASGGAEGLLWRGEAADEARRWQKRQGQEAATELHAREARYLAALVALERAGAALEEAGRRGIVRGPLPGRAARLDPGGPVEAGGGPRRDGEGRGAGPASRGGAQRRARPERHADGGGPRTPDGSHDGAGVAPRDRAGLDRARMGRARALGAGQRSRPASTPPRR